MSYELGIIGAGNMAEAITRGILKANVFKKGQVIASDPMAARREVFGQQLGVHVVEHCAQAVKDAKIVLVSVKPQHIAEALAEASGAIQAGTLVISIAAGISTGYIEKQLGAEKKLHVIRVMPNTPMLAGEGMAALAKGSHATAGDMATAQKIFAAAATVIEVSEDKIDAVTAVSGSGPAYFFYLVEQMVKAAVELGMTPEQAHTLATRTAAGSAKMMLTSKDTPAELRRKVSSPGGTTLAALDVMEQRGVGEAIVAAIHRAAERSKELGK